MSHTQSLGRTVRDVPPRVRDQAREVCAVMLFSAGVATALTAAIVLLASLGGQG